MTTSGELVSDSSLFGQPGGDDRTSPFFKTTLKLWTIAEAQARHDAWAAGEFDRIHGGQRGGYIDESGIMHEGPEARCQSLSQGRSFGVLSGSPPPHSKTPPTVMTEGVLSWGWLAHGGVVDDQVRNGREREI